MKPSAPLLSAAAALLMLGADAARAQAPDLQPRAVVELFTSQGCSSCPPADALFVDLAKQPDIITLTLPVTYWDYLGWKDTLGKDSFAKRQKYYAKARGDGQVYTPQAVINGAAHVVNYKTEDFVARVKAITGGVGAFQNGLRANSLDQAIQNTGLPTAVQSINCVGEAVPALDLPENAVLIVDV